MSEKITKSVLKVRIEELAGGYVLYQVLEQDKILDGIKYKDIQRVFCPSVGDDYNYLRGSQIELDFQPDYSNEATKETILERFKEILDWEGFHKSSNQEINIFSNGNRYSIILSNPTERIQLIEYKLWEEDDKVYLKVVHCNEYLRSKSMDISKREFLETYKDICPIQTNSRICFKGSDSYLDNNVYWTSKSNFFKTPQEISEIVKEALEKEFCKPSKNLVEFKETSPNIYEILVTEV